MSSLVYKQMIRMHEHDHDDFENLEITQSFDFTRFDKVQTETLHNTVLHLALKSGNNRSVEVLL